MLMRRLVGLNLNKLQRVGLCLSSCVICLSCAVVLWGKSEIANTPNKQVARDWILSIVREERDKVKDLMVNRIKPNAQDVVDRYSINPGGELTEVQFLTDVDGYLEFLVVTDNVPRYPKWSLKYRTEQDKISQYEFSRLNPLDKRDSAYVDIY